MWRTHPTPQLGDSQRVQPTTLRGQLPYLGTQTDMASFRVHNKIQGRGMLYAMDTPSTPSAEVREALIGFWVGNTAAPRLSELQRAQLLGHCAYLNSILWTTSTIRQHTSFAEHEPRSTPSPTHRNGGYTSCLDLSGMRGIPLLPPRCTFTLPSTPPSAPTPLPWTPKYQSEQ
jgi:hypothetical protein